MPNVRSDHMQFEKVCDTPVLVDAIWVQQEDDTFCEHSSGVNYFRKKLHIKCFTGISNVCVVIAFHISAFQCSLSQISIIS